MTIWEFAHTNVQIWENLLNRKSSGDMAKDFIKWRKEIESETLPAWLAVAAVLDVLNKDEG